jgi:ADP-heptose:LPS heptosyltransferase
VFGAFTAIRNRIGFVDEIVFWRRAFYTHMTFFNSHGHAYAFYDMLATWFEVEGVSVTDFDAGFRRRVLDERSPGDVVPTRGSIVVAPACSNFGKERELSPEEWRRVLVHDSIPSAAVVVLGAASDSAMAEAVIQALGGGVNLCGKLSLVQAARVIAEARIFYGIDSLLLHLARSLGVPVISFWGPTHPATRLRQLGTKDRIAYVNPPCSPCIHVHETPPCKGARPCMEAAVASLVEGRTEAATAAMPPIGWGMGPDWAMVRRVSVGTD